MNKIYRTKEKPPRLERADYIKALTEELRTTQDLSAKEEVTANLANFCYNPINHEHMLVVNVAEAFLGVLSDTNKVLVRFGLMGLVNLSVNPSFEAQIRQGMPQITPLIESDDIETRISALTMVYYMGVPSEEADTLPLLLRGMLTSSSCRRTVNLVKVLLKIEDDAID